MKKLFVVTLLIVMLCQALPVEALASVGRVLTQDELNRARALTGLSFGQDPANERAYHSGMKPNAGWTATQLKDWLDEKLDKDLGSTCDALSQAFYTLADMQQSDPAKYRRFTENSQYTNARSMQLQAEKLREEMRYYRDRIKEASGVIAEMSRWLEEERSGIFDSDAVRYSARIREAQQIIVQFRAAILENSDAWESEIASLKHYLKFGPSEKDHMLGVGEWMETLLKDDEPVVKKATLTRSNSSSSLKNRLQMASGLMGDADAQITVYSDNEVVIQLQAEVDGKLVPVDGPIVKTRDALDPNSDWEVHDDYKDGAVLVSINKLTADEYGVYHLGVDIDPTALGYQYLVFDNLDMERGTIYNCLLTPDGGSAANDNENRPYPYKMSFATHDIMQTEYDMVYSVANDYEFDVCIGLSNADDIQGVKMRYYDYKGNPCDVDPTSQTGDVYTFSGPWKQRFSPYVKDQCPAFIITDSQGDQTFSSKLVSVQSATDAPINEGTGPDGGVFANVLDTFKGSFTIPVVNITFSLNLPLPEYIPKVSINPGGYIVIYLGSSALTNEVHKGAVNMWQSKDMKEYQRAQKSIEEDNAFASYDAKYDQAKEFYKQKKFKCLGSFSLDVGIYGVVSGRWDLFDNDGEDILSKRITIKGGAGMTLTLNASWVFYPFPAVPLFYVSVSIGLSVGMAFSLSVELCWVNNAFQGWTLNALENITIDIGVLLAFQLGVGIKDFLEGYVKGWATFDVIFSLKSKAPCTLTIVGVAGFTVGVTIFMFSTTKSFGWDPYTFYPPESIGNLLRHYMNADDDEPTDVAPGYGEPQSYPALAAEAKQKCSTTLEGSDGYPSKLIECNDNLLLFSIYNATGADGKQHKRVGYRYIDPFGDITMYNSLQDFIDQDTTGNHNTVNERDDYDFDVCSANDHIFVLATAAKEFDEDGYPVRNDMSKASYNNRDLNQIAWMMILTCSPELAYCKNTLHVQSFQWNKDAPKVEYSYDSLGKPHISYARFHINSDHTPDHEMFGEIGRVSYPDDPNPVGTTGIGFDFNESTVTSFCFLMYPDKSVGSGMGDGYEFIKTCSLMDLDVSGRVGSERASYVNMSSMSFVGLSRPKDGAAGDNALELFPFGMNEADRRAIVLEQGGIGSIVAVKDLDTPEGEHAGTTVFYTLGETNGDGATRYRLCSIHIGPVTSPLTPDLVYDLTRYSYDVVLPASDFDICRMGTVPYLYWMNTATKEKESDPDVWRVWAMPYDSLTNSLGSPFVFSEFTLPRIVYSCFEKEHSYWDEHPMMKNVMLTGTGKSYLNAAFSDVESIPEEDRPKRTPYSVCEIPEQLTPSAKMISAAPKEMVAKAGSFDDFSVSVMNDGNMAIAAFDLGLYLVSDSGDEELVETAHMDALDPTKNAITMADGTVVTSGESACYRKEDFDNTSRKHDWVLDHEAFTYKIYVADGKATVDKQTVEPSDPQHITTDIMMPGSAVGYTVSYKIPDDWEGGVKTLRIKVTSASTFAHWMRAAALAAGARANGTLANANANGELVELKYVLNEKTGKLELQKPANLTASLADALQSGLIAREFETDSVPVMVEVHDLEVSHRVYEGLGGERWLDISIRNHAATREGMKLVCAVYVDGSNEPYYINLPYYEDAALSHKTQTISLPVSALVDDPDAHRSARVEIMAVGRDERAYANNEFSLYLGGGEALHFTTQPEDATVQEGEDVSFGVEVAGGVKPYAYRWQVYNPGKGKWVDLEGYADPTITRESIEKKWDGCKFRCVVTDAAGAQIISRVATLTVRDKMPTGDDSNLPLYLAAALIALMLMVLLRRRAKKA